LPAFAALFTSARGHFRPKIAAPQGPTTSAAISRADQESRWPWSVGQCQERHGHASRFRV